MSNKPNLPTLVGEDMMSAVFGKIPPQAVEVECAVVGALILEPYAAIENLVRAEWFYKDENQKIVSQILEMVNEGKLIDLITVTSRLRDSGIYDEVGGAVYIASLTRNVIGAYNIRQHLRIIHDKFVRREIIRLSFEVNKLAYDESNDVDDVIERLHHNTLGVMDFDPDKVRDFKYALNQLARRIADNEKADSGVTGIPTGFSILDRHTGGWQRSDMVVIAGEPSQGKTSLALKFAIEAATAEIPGAIYSLEMSLLQLTARIVSGFTKISGKKMLVGKLDPYEVQLVGDSIFRLGKLPLFIDDDVTNKLSSILLSIRRLKLKHNIQWAVVDYIQNVTEDRGRTDEQNLGIIAKSLKNLAKELNIVIFVVSQLSRNKERPFPSVSRLRGSGQIEETADIVISVFRPEYYRIGYPSPWEEVRTEGTGLISILKGRNIGTGNFFARFDGTTTTWSSAAGEFAENGNEDGTGELEF